MLLLAHRHGHRPGMAVGLKQHGFQRPSSEITDHARMPPQFLRLIDIIIEKALRPALTGNPLRRKGKQKGNPFHHPTRLTVPPFKGEHEKIHPIQPPVSAQRPPRSSTQQRKAPFDEQCEKGCRLKDFSPGFHLFLLKRPGKEVIHQHAFSLSGGLKRFPSVGPHIPVRPAAEDGGNHILLPFRFGGEGLRFLLSRKPAGDLGTPIIQIHAENAAVYSLFLRISQKHFFLHAEAFLR